MGRPPYLAVALLSGAAIGYEILLTRLFSIIQWHHFAHMAISLALLGYGVSGTLLALAGARMLRHYRAAFSANAALFGITAVGAYLIAQSLPFNPLELLWDTAQPWWLATLYLLLATPFLFAANAIALTFQAFPALIPRSYAADLLGAGAGSLGVIGLLWWLPPLPALITLGTIALFAAALGGGHPRWALLVVPVALLVPQLLPELPLTPSPYKPLSQALRVSGAQLVAERSSPLGLISVVENRAVPLRHAPGLALTSPAIPGEQLALFRDGDGPTAILHGAADHTFLAHLPSALSYQLLDRPEVLLLGVGGGMELAQALHLGASRVDGVELNRQLIELMSGELTDYSGGLYRHPKVTIHPGETRGFLATTDRRYDLIQLALADSYAGAAGGLHGVGESYLLTVEAFQSYLDHLRPGGLLAITRWLTLPPRDALKLTLLASHALEGMGVDAPGERLALIRGWNSVTLLVKSGPLGGPDIATLRRFCADNGFDPAWYPGMRRDEANRVNHWRSPQLFDGASTLLGERRDDFVARYKYDLRPASDERPYFFDLFRWRLLEELKGGRGRQALMEWGYPVLIATLLQAALAGALLILLPLALTRRRRTANERRMAGRVIPYFLAIGLAFIFLEIAFIQRFTLFLHHPLYAVAVVLCAFLLFAGVGSRLAPRVAARFGPRRAVSLATGVIAGVTLLYLPLLPPLFAQLGHLPDAARITISLLLIAPPALAMGLPFPLALSTIATPAKGLIPWAWGVNGWGSVVGAGLATLLAVHAGFIAVTLAALILYLLATIAFPKP